MTITKATEAILKYFEENGDVFADCIEELDSYNGYLNDDRYYEMEMLEELWADAKPMDLLQRAFYGYDETDWTFDSCGNKERAAFNLNKRYFRYNGCGNLVSSDYKDYTDFLDSYAVEQLSQYRRWIPSIDDDEALSELFDELECDGEDGEDEEED